MLTRIGTLIGIAFFLSCASSELARPSDGEVEQALRKHIGDKIRKQWRVEDIVTLQALEVVHTSRAGQLCHVRAEGAVLFHQTLGPQNVLGFGGLQGQRKSFSSEMNFLRQNGEWRLQSAKFKGY